jgi:hypothetical protein
MYLLQHYVVQWDRVKTFEDLKKVMSAMDFRFEQDYKYLDDVIEYCDLVDKTPSGFKYD